MRAILILVLFFFGSLNIIRAEPEIPRQFIWGIWYNSYQKPYITFQEKYDRALFVEHLNYFQKIGINRIYFLIKFPTGHVFYNSKIAPRHPDLDWDPFAFIVSECHRRGIEIYPYVNIFPEGEYNEITQKHDVIGPYLEKFPNYSMMSQDGTKYGWASPAIPEVVAYELSILEEIVQNYNIDGIQFDRIRYPDSQVDYNPQTIALYQKQYKKNPVADDYDWAYFRQELLTHFIIQAKQKIHSINPNIKISVAVFPRPYVTIINELQPWPRWCRQELLDEIVPMSYYKDAESFATYIQQEQEVTPPFTQMLSGIGAFFIADAQVIEQQIQSALNQGVQGIVFFNGYHLLDPAKAIVIKKYTNSKSLRKKNTP